MKRLLVVLSILITASLIQSQTIGKKETRYGFEVDVKPRIYYDAYFTYSPDGWKPNFNLVLKIQNDLLQFTKGDDNYHAEYDVVLSILKGESGAPVVSDIWSRSVKEKKFDKTNSTGIYQVENKILPLNAGPGEYNLVLDVTDTGSDKVYKSTRKLIIADTSNQSINHTGIRLLSASDSLSAEIPIGESLPIVEFNQDLIVLFEIESSSDDSITIISNLNHIVKEQEISIQNYENKFYSPDKHFRHYDHLSRNLFQEGIHTLNYIVKIGSQSLDIKKKFNVVWYKKPLYLQETELAVRPLKYILESTEWQKVDDMSFEELQRWFWNYWKENDPTKETPYNEIQYEFYFRVDLANNEFSLRFKEGWETDRGYAMIVYGEPDKREKHHYVTNTKPYEIWHYNAQNKKATFVDVEGNNDYKLIAIEEISDE
jgi:GWxTD domain-containing protein